MFFGVLNQFFRALKKDYQQNVNSAENVNRERNENVGVIAGARECEQGLRLRPHMFDGSSLFVVYLLIGAAFLYMGILTILFYNHCNDNIRNDLFEKSLYNSNLKSVEFQSEVEAIVNALLKNKQIQTDNYVRYQR